MIVTLISLDAKNISRTRLLMDVKTATLGTSKWQKVALSPLAKSALPDVRSAQVLNPVIAVISGTLSKRKKILNSFNLRPTPLLTLPMPPLLDSSASSARVNAGHVVTLTIVILVSQVTL